MKVDIKFGNQDHFLHITRNDSSDIYSTISIHSKSIHGDSFFEACNSNVLFECQEKDLSEFDSFERLGTNSCSIKMTENCSIVLFRNTRGQIEIKYQIARWKIRTIVSGVIVTEGEYSIQVCNDIRKLFFNADSIRP